MAQPYKAMYKHNNNRNVWNYDPSLLNINIAYVRVYQSVNATVITAAILFFVSCQYQVDE